MCMSSYLETVFGKRVFPGMIKNLEMSLSGILWVGPKCCQQASWEAIERERHTQKRRLCGDKGRDGSDVDASRRMLGTNRSWKRQGMYSPWFWPTENVIELLASRNVRRKMSVVSSHQVCSKILRHRKVWEMDAATYFVQGLNTCKVFLLHYPTCSSGLCLVWRRLYSY